MNAHRMPAGPIAATPAAAGWTATARALHWTIAALIVVQLALGWLAKAWPLTPAKLDLFVWHKSTGLVVLGLVLVRLGWRAGHAVPPLPAGTPRWARRAARASHGLLYALPIALPLSGWVVSSASGVPFRVFRAVPLPALVAPDRALAEAAAVVHGVFSIALVVVVAGHVGAALWHHVVRRDDVLRRMWRGARA